MKNNEIQFEDFLLTVDPAYMGFVNQIHDFLLLNGCTIKIALAKNGYLVSYTYAKMKRVIMNFVFRKKGLVIRIYGDHVNKYMDFLETLPEAMIKSIEKSPVCKRLVDPVTCNSRCSMGYDFKIHGAHYQRCKYNCFMFEVNEENNPFLKTFLENELKERAE